MVYLSFVYSYLLIHEWLAHLFNIREATGSNLGEKTCYHKIYLSFLQSLEEIRVWRITYATTTFLYTLPFDAS